MAANQNVTQLTQQTGSAATTSLFYAVINSTTDTGLPLSVLVNNLGLTGTPTVPTATTGTNTTQIASTAFVQAQLTSSLASYAPLASPTFTGTVTIPTIALSGGTINNTTVGATTPSTGAFTTLSSSGLATLSSVSTSSATISGGTVNGTSVGATTPSTGKFTTLGATGLISPTSTIGIAGTTTNDNAQAGSIGETVVSQITSNTAWAPATGVAGNLTSISLTAGDWDLMGSVFWAAAAGSCTWTLVQAGTTSVSAALPGAWACSVQAQATASAQLAGYTTPVLRVSIASTTTMYLVGQVNYTSGTMNYQCQLMARRRR